MTKSGYITINVKDDHGERHTKLAHRFIYWCFNPNFDQSMEIDHDDENRSNNNITNLIAMTKAEHQKKTRRQIKVPYDKIKRIKGGQVENERWFQPTETVTEFLGLNVAFVSDMGRISTSGHERTASYGLLWENGTYMFKNVAVARIVCATFRGPPPGPGYFARHTNGDRKDNRYTNLAWAETATGSFLPPRCWATASWDIMSSQQLANLLREALFTNAERDNLNQGTTVYKWEADLESVWCEYAVAYPCVYKVFDLHESTGVYIKCKKVFKLLSYKFVRGNTNSTRKNHHLILFTRQDHE
jgi:hypothetical protein